MTERSYLPSSAKPHDANSVGHSQLSRCHLLIRIFATLGLAALASGCQRTSSWDEEVQFADGTVLTVDRAVLFGRRDMAIGQSHNARRVIEERLTFTDSESGQKVVWQQPHRIVSWIDRIDGQYWIVAKTTTACEAGYIGRPYWVAYVLRDSDWVEVSAEQAPAVKTPNLLLGTGSYAMVKDLTRVNLNLKRNLDTQFQIRNPRDLTISLRFVFHC
jgi:hypothetical protein